MAELSIARPFSAQLSAIARSVSDLFSPAALSVPCLLLGVLASDEPGTYRYAVLYFFVAIPIPVAYVFWLLRSGQVSDFHLPDRRDRTGPFLVAIAGAVCAAILLAFLGAPSIFLAPVVTALLLTLGLFLITLKWQISIHSATTTALVTFAILALGPGAAVLALCIPLVIWARMYLGRHTLAQSLAGACLGCATFMALFALRGNVW